MTSDCIGDSCELNTDGKFRPVKKKRDLVREQIEEELK